MPPPTSSAPARRCSPTGVSWWSAAPRPRAAWGSRTSRPSTGARGRGTRCTNALPALVRDGHHAGRRQRVRHLGLEQHTSATMVPIPEMYSTKDNTWRDLTAASTRCRSTPSSTQLPDGRIVHLGGSEYPTPSEVLDLTTNRWSTFDQPLRSRAAASPTTRRATSSSPLGVRQRLQRAVGQHGVHAGHERPRRHMAALRHHDLARSFPTSPTCPTGTVLATGARPTSPGSPRPTRC